MERCDIAIIGAGPYGLSAAAHLKAIKGLDVRVLGEPMSFWQCYMPKGMLLRSPKPASNLVDPDNQFNLDAYKKATGSPLHLKAPAIITEKFIADDYETRIPLEEFIQYGHWFQKQNGITVERRKVVQVEKNGDGFHLPLEDGEMLSARRVVVATGIQQFAYRPELFRQLPSALVSHTSWHRDLEEFRGKEVLVVGAGQSATETATLLYENGANVELLVREKAMRWFGLKPWMKNGLIGKMLYGKGDVGPAFLSQLVQRPYLYRQLSRERQDTLGFRSIRAGAACWVMGRMKHIPIHTERSIVQAQADKDRIRVRLNDGTERTVDHVMLGTGYRVNVAEYPFLGQGLLEQIKRVNGYPCLEDGYESTAAGLHFIGAPAMWSYGPLMRFVAGAEFTCQNLQQKIRRVAKA